MRTSPILRQAKKPKEAWQKFKGGQHFPVHTRYIDKRAVPYAAETYTEFQPNREPMRSNFVTGKVRQTEVPLNAQHIRPTHFFSLRIPTNTHFMAQVGIVHSDIVDFQAEYEQLLIPTKKLHVTTSVAAIDSEEAVAKVVEAATALVEDNAVAPFRLFSRGLGQFNHRVVYARIAAEKDFGRLDRFVSKLRLAITEGVCSPSTGSIGEAIPSVQLKGNPNDSYVPHVTLAKIRPQHIAQFGKTIPIDLWTPYQYEDFGEFVVPTLDLCEMATDEATGGYKVVASIPFVQ